MSESKFNQSEPEPNPYQVTTVDEIGLPPLAGPVFGAVYWAINVLVIVSIVATPFLLPISSAAFPLILLLPAVLTTIRSWQFLYRVKVRRMNGLRTILPDPAQFYFSSFAIGWLGSLASVTAFACTCIPLGALVFDLYSVTPLIVVSSICAVPALLVGIWVNRLGLPGKLAVEESTKTQPRSKSDQTQHPRLQ